MNITFNIDPKLVERLVAAVEQLASDYSTVHASELNIVRIDVDKHVGASYYQSDRDLYEAELKERLARESELL